MMRLAYLSWTEPSGSFTYFRSHFSSTEANFFFTNGTVYTSTAVLDSSFTASLLRLLLNFFSSNLASSQQHGFTKLSNIFHYLARVSVHHFPYTSTYIISHWYTCFSYSTKHPTAVVTYTSSLAIVKTGHSTSLPSSLSSNCRLESLAKSLLQHHFVRVRAFWHLLCQNYAGQQTFRCAEKSGLLLITHFLHHKYTYNQFEINLNISSTRTCQVLLHPVLFSATSSTLVQLLPVSYVSLRRMMPSTLTLACHTQAAGIQHLAPISFSYWAYQTAIVYAELSEQLYLKPH